MKLAIKIGIVGILALAVSLTGCGAPNDPILDDLYTQNIYPGTASTYSIGSEDLPYSEGWFDGLTVNEEVLEGPLTLIGDGLVYFELRSDLDFETVRAQGKPTQVSRGLVHGFSLPIYNNDNEELFFEAHVPYRWDGVSDIIVHLHCYLDTANNDKRYNLQFSWEHFTDGDIIPNTSNDLAVETLTGTAPQFKSFHIDYIIDYDIDVGDEIISTDELHFRVRRLAASQDEIAGEVVITHVGLVFRRDKLGAPAM